MQERQELNIQFLRNIVKNNFSLPADFHPFDLVLEIMPNLHSPNSELRDELTYNILVNVLLQKRLTERQTVELLRQSIGDDYLFYRIGETETDSVFARGFGVLIAAAIVEIDAQSPELPIEEVRTASKQIVKYAFEERDHRGFIDGKGWAHSVAHTADALDSCAHHPYATLADQELIIDAIHYLATVPHPLNHLEDDRLAYAALRMILKDQDCVLDWNEWISKFGFKPGSSKVDDLRNANAGHFLRALYFMLVWEHPSSSLIERIQLQIKTIHAHYRYGTLPIVQP